jgi:hypothetical protein
MRCRRMADASATDTREYGRPGARKATLELIFTLRYRRPEEGMTVAQWCWRRSFRLIAWPMFAQMGGCNGRRELANIKASFQCIRQFKPMHQHTCLRLHFIAMDVINLRSSSSALTYVEALFINQVKYTTAGNRTQTPNISAHTSAR